MHRSPVLFDGHNDLLSRLQREGGLSAIPSFREGRETGALDLPKARAGGFAGGFFALYAASSGFVPLARERALDDAIEQSAILFELERRGDLRICRSVEAIRSCMEEGMIAAIFHLEGAEAIDSDLHALDLLHRAGLRSLGLAWSRPSIFCEGVPFRFPADPDIGEGLTEHGARLVERCGELGIMLDLSHLNAAGFRDVARLSSAPLVATHSNAHAICPHPRNLDDAQLSAIAESDGMVGLNFAVTLLREDGKRRTDVAMDLILRHLDHLLERLGEDRVGFGSDYDGALVPDSLRDASRLPELRRALEGHGYGAELIAKLLHGNWLRVLERTWKP